MKEPQLRDGRYSHTMSNGSDVYRPGYFDVDEVKNYIKSVKELNAELVEALTPFANCNAHIDQAGDDEEWAKFRLLIKDYRRAKAALDKVGAA